MIKIKLILLINMIYSNIHPLARNNLIKYLREILHEEKTNRKVEFNDW